MSHRSDTAYIHTNPNCIGEHAIKARSEIFAHIDEIAKEMGTIAKTASNDAGIPRKLRAGDWYQNVVSILGERGSGKTILLLSACACLVHDKNTYTGTDREDKHEKIHQKVHGDILLPIIQPEYFGQEDTLITWILTYLKDYIEDKSNQERFKKIEIKQDDDNEHEVGIRLSEFVDRLRQDETLFSRKFSSHLAAQDVTASDFQLETLAVVDSHARFMSDWKNLVNKLIVTKEIHKTSTERENRPFLIIPIDDADLNPAALPVILQQIQILQHPNVLFLFSVNEKSLHSMMYISQLELNTNRSDTRPVVNFDNLIERKLREVEDVRTDAVAKIDKFLPRKYRVQIQPLSPKDRLNYKPLINNDKNETFVQLLKKIPMQILFGSRSQDVSQLFDLAQSFERCPIEDTQIDSPYCEVCQLRYPPQSKEQGSGKPINHCGNPNVKKLYGDYEKEKTKEIEQELGRLSPPIPSIYVDALPKYPRAMNQLYQILQRRALEIQILRGYL